MLSMYLKLKGYKMETLIGANEMQAGDIIRFYGADFILGEVTRWTFQGNKFATLNKVK